MLAEAVCGDGHLYEVRPLEWHKEKAVAYWHMFKQYEILPKQFVESPQDFIRMLTGAVSLWFEVVDTQEGAVVGVIYLTDFIPSVVRPHALDQANIHCTIWDRKITLRRPILRAAVRAIFKRINVHRLQAEVWERAIGAQRALVKFGFTKEGVLRSARYEQGKWFDVALFSLLEGDVDE